MHSDILDELYRQYYGAALLYVLSLCRDRALAEELVHDAFVKAYLSLPDDAPSFPFWLMKVCRNLWYDHARRQKFLSAEPVPEQMDETTPETLRLQFALLPLANARVFDEPDVVGEIWSTSACIAF